MLETTARVLLADDRSDKLLAMEAVLLPLKVEIVTTRSGREAVEWAEKEEFAVILLDVRMPVMDGFETARRIRAGTRNARTPIIFVSAAETPDLLEQGYALGAVDYIRDLVPQILRSKVSVFIDLYLQRMDLTERKIIEEQLRQAKQEAEAANAAKDRFLAALSHELRTPLTPVVALLPTLLECDSLSEQFKADLRMIQRNVQLETQIINDLLDLTMVTKGRMHLSLQKADATSIIRHSLQIVAPEAEQRGVKIEVDLKAEDATVWGDAIRLEQVLWNLLKNAIKFSEAGGEVRIRTSNPRPGVLRISVLDFGVGMESEELDRVFRAFEQPHDDAGYRFGGLGMGLYISRAIAVQHGAKLEGYSEGRGRGSTFSLEMSVCDPSTEEPLTQRLGDTLSIRPLRLLLVEDHANTREVMTRLLTRKGHQVKAAENVHEALNLAAGNEFDLIISDLGLPDGSGLELMPALKSLYGLRGIAVSGYGREEDLQKSRRAGFDAHLIKPVNFKDLENAVQRLVGSDS